MKNIEIIQGDITKACVDAIVNAANPYMLGGGGVDGAIHKAAGPSLLEACRRVSSVNGVRCPTGEARITEAGKLDARFVIHTVGPVYNRVSDPERLLRSAYISSLNLALEHQCNSIAFPAISCGVYGYPFDEAARIAFAVCRDEKFNSLVIKFFLFGRSILNGWNTVFQQMGK